MNENINKKFKNFNTAWNLEPEIIDEMSKDRIYLASYPDIHLKCIKKCTSSETKKVLLDMWKEFSNKEFSNAI